MQENTNRAIAYNSVILYIKMAINTICALLTTRFALRALGVVDYGLFAVLGGIISLIAIFNTIMLSTSNRFIAVAIGKGDQEEINKQLNVNLIVHLAIAILALTVAIPIGKWYIPRYINYEGPLSNAMMVYVVSISASIFSFIGVPYNGLLMAKERFIVFSLVDVILHILKLSVAWLLVYHFENKLLIYTLMMAFMTASPTVVYYLYCKRHFPNFVRFRIVRDRKMYKNVFGFSSWVAVGAFAQVGKDQGAALVVNTFFNTVMNTAMGVASSINVYVRMFANNVVQPMQPQITKSYASGDTKRTDELLIMSTKYSFLFVFLAGSFFLLEPEWILGLWLGEVPPFASVFLVLFIIDNLIQSLNSGVGNILWADGRIGLFQIVVSLFNILSVVAGYFVLRVGYDAYYLMIVYIIVSFVKFFAIQWALHHTLNYDNRVLWKNSYLPSLLVVVLFLPVFFTSSLVHPSIRVIVSFLYLCILIYFVGLTKKERKRLNSFVQRRLSKIK